KIIAATADVCTLIESSTAERVWETLVVNVEPSFQKAEDDVHVERGEDDSEEWTEVTSSTKRVWRALAIDTEASTQKADVNVVQKAPDVVTVEPSLQKADIVVSQKAVEVVDVELNDPAVCAYGRTLMNEIRAAIGAAQMTFSNYKDVSEDENGRVVEQLAHNVLLPRAPREKKDYWKKRKDFWEKNKHRYWENKRNGNQKQPVFTPFTHTTDHLREDDGDNLRKFNGWAAKQKQEQEAKAADGEWEWHLQNEETSGSSEDNDERHSRKNSDDHVPQRSHSQEDESHRAHQESRQRRRSGENDSLERQRDDWLEWRKSENRGHDKFGNLLREMNAVSLAPPPGLPSLSPKGTRPAFRTDYEGRALDESKGPDLFGNNHLTVGYGLPPGLALDIGQDSRTSYRSDHGEREQERQEGGAARDDGFGKRTSQDEYRNGLTRNTDVYQNLYCNNARDDHYSRGGSQYDSSKRYRDDDSNGYQHRDSRTKQDEDRFGNSRDGYSRAESSYDQRYKEEDDRYYQERSSRRSEDREEARRSNWKEVDYRETRVFNESEDEEDKYRRRRDSREEFGQRESGYHDNFYEREERNKRRSVTFSHNGRDSAGYSNDNRYTSKNQVHLVTLSSGLRVTRDSEPMNDTFRSADERSFRQRGPSSHDCSVTRRFIGASNDVEVTLHETAERASTSASVRETGRSNRSARNQGNKARENEREASLPHQYTQEEMMMLAKVEMEDRLKARMYRDGKPIFPALNKKYGADLPECQPLRKPSSSTKWVRGSSDYMPYHYDPATDTASPVEDADISTMYREGKVNARSLFAMKFESEYFYKQEQLLNEKGSEESPFNGVLERKRRETEIHLDTFHFEEWTEDIKALIEQNEKWEKKHRR
ncbi:hypothetical protein PENTCL1PPCAC_8439, partial [Pristionchus entomophagus]